MMRKTISFWVLSVFVILLLASSCKTTQKVADDQELETLLAMMSGSFNSAEQEALDSSYYNISLHMYPVWTERDGNWIYVEQALNDMQDKPYRQRFYQVKQTGKNTFQTTIYALSNPDEAIGKWKTPAWFDQFDEAILAERDGCGVFLKKKKNGSYEGSTAKEACKSTMRGASYATSVVTISEGVVYSWDQGFDADGKQVWGAVKGGYIFKSID